MGITGLSDYIVYTESLTRQFKTTTAVDNLDLKVRRGEIFGLIGSDGAGKTTTIKMLCGLLKPTSGIIFIDGHNVEEEPDAVRSAIGYMSQNFTLYMDMSVEENINFVADLRGIEEEDRQRQKKRLLRFSRMEPFRDRRAGALSGGMKKKLALSCSLIHRPEVLILDEPTTAVDPVSRSELWRILYEFIVQGITIIISTPYMDEAERCHRVALMQEGMVIACDTPENLKKMINKNVYSFKTKNTNRTCKILREGLDVNGQIYGDRIRIHLDDHGREIHRIEKALADRGHIMEECLKVLPNMDDVYMSLIEGDQNGYSKEESWIPFNLPKICEDTIIVSDITKKFGDFTAVESVSFDVKAGTVFGLLGPNGAGKTTIIKMLCGLLSPTSGGAIVAGYDIVTRPRMVKSKIGYMSQLFSLYPDLTVEQNLDLYGSIYEIDRRERKLRKEWVIELAGLKGKEKFLTSGLAGGWKQKLALGCAVMHQPALLFLDEPTSGVDPVARMEFWDIIHRFSEEGITTLVTTHFMDEAERCGILGLMNEGRLIAMGAPNSLKQDLPIPFYEISTPSVLETYDKLVSIDFEYQPSLFGDKIHITTGDSGQELKIEDIRSRGVVVDDLVKISPSLEDVFNYHVMFRI
ncbi:MAG: ATP-binding cassette domain-containing protein [Thermodesulfobacteriota bacterium]|nr:ATP-binding cassette domain-containing protein [Thermodesulfobacteriota bacterium]